MKVKTKFNIVDERTINYGGNDKLYLMILRINGSFYFEINSQSAFIIRRMTKDYTDADLLFLKTESGLRSCKDFSSALRLIKLTLSIKNLQVAGFLIYVMHQELDYEKVI